MVTCVLPPVPDGDANLFVFPADTRAEGIWAELAGLKDPELQRLVALLLATVLHSRADSTVGKYGRAFQQWKCWVESHDEVTVLPVNEVHLALYLQHLGEKLHSSSAVQEAVNVIGRVHQLSGLNPCSHSVIICVGHTG